MKQWLLLILFLISTSQLTSCATQEVTAYKNVTPQLDLEKYFVGTTDAWGIFQKRSGEVTKRFHVVIAGSQKDGHLILDEHFTYDDGSKQQRIWTLVQSSDGSWTGTAADIVGQANGRVSGNTLHWQYVLALPIDGDTYHVNVDDWLYLMDDSTILNRSSIKKFGIEFGQVTLFFKKRS